MLKRRSSHALIEHQSFVHVDFVHVDDECEPRSK